jgi:hypothetical protein
MAHEEPSVRSEKQRGLKRRLLPFLLVVPIVLVPTISVLVAFGGSGSTLQVAPGAAGGVFHPVAGNFAPDGTALADCGHTYGCLEQAFGNLSFEQGPRRALAVFGKELDRNLDVERDCHRIVHTIGSAAYARYDGNVAKTFSQGSSICASGYYHGILERAFVGITSKAKLGAVARRLCVDAGIRRRGFLDYQCRHGLGHGFMIQTGYDLPMALSLCSGLGTGWDRVTCTSGSFMENVNTRFGFRSRFLDEKRPLYPCTDVARVFRASCYVRVTTWVLSLTKDDFSRTAAVCRSAGPRWSPFCFRGFGRDAVVDARYRDFRRVRELCALSGARIGDCYYGAARTFGDGEGATGVEGAARFCDSAPASERDHCVAGLGIVVGLLQPTGPAREAMCARLAAREAMACSASASAEVDPSGRGSWG